MATLRMASLQCSGSVRASELFLQDFGLPDSRLGSCVSIVDTYRGSINFEPHPAKRCARPLIHGTRCTAAPAMAPEILPERRI